VRTRLNKTHAVAAAGTGPNQFPNEKLTSKWAANAEDLKQGRN
jgi:hypothetical protein